MRPLPSLLATLVLSLLFCACAQSSRKPAPPGPSAIHGRVVFEGEIPPTQIITPKPPLNAVFPQGIPYTRYLVSSDRGLAEVVVSIVNPPADPPAPPTAPQLLSISNTICIPRVLAIHTNQPVQFSVRGKQMFNLNSTPTRGRGFNQAVVGDMDFEKWFPYADARYRIMDNVYVWLNASIYTFDHPWFAVTGPDGSFELPPLPPGRYTLQIEHRTGERSTREIDVPLTGPLSLQLPANTSQAGL